MNTFTPHEYVNPWDEGDYRVYGLAILAPNNLYWPAYVVERVNGIPDAPREAIGLHEVQIEPCGTPELASLMGVSFGVQRVRDGDRLEC